MIGGFIITLFVLLTIGNINFHRNEYKRALRRATHQYGKINVAAFESLVPVPPSMVSNTLSRLSKAASGCAHTDSDDKKSKSDTTPASKLSKRMSASVMKVKAVFRKAVPKARRASI